MAQPASPINIVTQWERRLPELYLLLALAITALLCILTPPFFTPDEPHHAARAIALGHGVLLPHTSPQETGAAIDENALTVMDRMDDIREAAELRSPNFLNRPWGPADEALQQRQSGVRWARLLAYAPFPNTAVYPPALYLPAVIGWRIAESQNLTIFQSLRLARLLTAITAVLLGWLALRLCRGIHWLLLACLLLPSTLFLNASCSQDAVLLSAAALVAALVSRPLTAHREFNRAELLATAICLALCGTARPPYLAMALILFLPTIQMHASNWRRWLAPATAFAVVLAVAAWWRHLVYPLGIDLADRANPIAQTLFLRQHPLTAAPYLVHGTFAAGLDLFERGLYVLGWDDLLAPHPLMLLTAAALLLILLGAPRSPISRSPISSSTPRTWPARLLLTLAVAAPLVGVTVAEYLIWTPPASPLVFGIQPRYWLPIMPLGTMLLASILPSDRPTGPLQPTRRAMLLAGSAILAGIACTLPWMVAHAFYLQSVRHVLALNLK